MIIYVNYSLEFFTLSDNVYFFYLDKIKLIDLLTYDIFFNYMLKRQKIEENYQIHFIKKIILMKKLKMMNILKFI